MSTFAIRQWQIRSPIFETAEEEEHAPFEFDTTDLKTVAPAHSNYTEVKKKGMLLIMVSRDREEEEHKEVSI